MSFLLEVFIFFHQGLGARATASQLGTTRYQVEKAYKILNLDVKNKPKKKPPQNKICKICNKKKIISNFRKRSKGYECYCKPCEKEYNKKSCKKRYSKNKIKRKKYYQDNIKEKKKYNEKYYLSNKSKILAYKEKRKHLDKENQRIWSLKKRKTDPCFKLRGNVSNAINSMIRKQGETKKGLSCLHYLDYSFYELKIHLESYFEDWMSWDNWGVYKKDKWDDNDSSTWTWQIDHIIPQSCLPYDSFDHPNFKKCWCLNNLRPLSSKQNLLDGTALSRHF